jgi:hypothetical protein
MNTLEEDGGEEMCDAPRSTASPVEEAGHSGTGKVDGGGGGGGRRLVQPRQGRRKDEAERAKSRARVMEDRQRSEGGEPRPEVGAAQRRLRFRILAASEAVVRCGSNPRCHESRFWRREARGAALGGVR